MEIPFDYDPFTGILTWRSSRLRGLVGKPAGYVDQKGYLRVEWGSRKDGYRHRHPAAKVIWAIQTGVWPDFEIDHIDRNPLNNRWSNLRSATRSEQTQNRVRRRNFPYPPGVQKRGSRYQAAIAIDKRWIYLGMYATSAAAHQAYLDAREVLHPRRPL